jgi:hypothetical protein
MPIGAIAIVQYSQLGARTSQETWIMCTPLMQFKTPEQGLLEYLHSTTGMEAASLLEEVHVSTTRLLFLDYNITMGLRESSFSYQAVRVVESSFYRVSESGRYQRVPTNSKSGQMISTFGISMWDMAVTLLDFVCALL